MAEQEQSLEERVENLFTEEEPTPSEPEPEVTDEPVEEVAEEAAPTDEEPTDEPVEAFVEIEVDGELLEVPEKYKDHFLRQQDYTTKTQEVAQQRKELEVQLGAVEQTRKQFEFAESIRDDVAKAQHLEDTANQYHEYLRENIDSLSSTDIEKIRFSIEDSRRQRDELVTLVQGKQTEFQQAQEQSYQELLNQGTEVLKQRIPGWGEDAQKQVRDYALSNGLTEAEINQVVDPRYVEILYKASQYDALKAGAIPAIKKVQKAPSIKQKSRNPMPDDVKQKLNLRKKLKDRNATSKTKARLIQEAMGERFG